MSSSWLNTEIHGQQNGKNVDVLSKFVVCVLLRGKISCELKNLEELLCGILMSCEIGETLMVS